MDPVTEAQAQVDALIATALQTDAANMQAQEQLRLARLALADAQTALAAQVAAGTVRGVSSIDDAGWTERQAGKAAVISFVQANPGCSEADAVAAWNAGALAARPAGRQWLLHNTDGLLQEYMANLLAGNLITTATWSAMAAWIAATPAASILAM